MVLNLILAGLVAVLVVTGIVSKATDTPIKNETV